MHFNPEDNFYITLGVAQDAGLDDIRDRWKRLMLLYHPDRQEGGNEWVSERAKKVNEAYTELKDNSRRSAFDRKLAGQSVKVKPAQHNHTQTMPVSTHRRSIRPHENASWAKTRKYLPKALIVFYLAAAAIFFLFMYYQNDSSSLENEFLPNYSSTPQLSQETGDAELKSLKNDENIHETLNAADKEIKFDSDLNDPLPESPSSRSRSLDTDKKTFSTGTQASLEPSAYTMKERPFSVEPEKQKIFSSKDITQKQTSSPVLSMNSSLKKEDLQSNLSEKRYEPAEQKNDHPNAENRRTATQARIQEAKAEPVPAINSQDITKNQVEVFIQKYISAYRKNDLEEFMSLFSRSAIENNAANYNDIQKAYKETFTKKISNYDLQDINIVIDGRYALITGFYHANRYISSEDRWVKLSGNIRWKLAKEDNILKIMSINYDK